MDTSDFPILKKMHYLDNAATTQKPKSVLDAQRKFYETKNANPHRGIYGIAEEATKAVEDARKTIAGFINAQPEEIVFTRNTTDSLSQLARSLGMMLSRGQNIITTEIEHHSNFVPWQQVAKQHGAEFRVAKYDGKLQDPSELVDENTAIVAFTAMSNVSGLIPDTGRIVKRIREKAHHVIIVIDAAQAISHMKIDVKGFDCDFLAFSAHKLYGPTGVGILYGKKHLLERIHPFNYGGHMISKVTIEHTEWAEPPAKFEAGTLDGAGIVGTARAIEYVEKNDFEKLIKKENELKDYLVKSLKKIKGVKILGHDARNYGPIVSFTVDGIHPHDLAAIADKHNVCIRAGHHCAQPFMDAIKETATSRASISFYNTKDDVDRLTEAIHDARLRILGKDE